MFNTLAGWLSSNLLLLSLALLAASLIMLFLLLVLFLRLNRLTKSHKSLMSGMEGLNLEELLESYLTKVHSAEVQVKELEAICHKLEDYAKNSLQNVALLRFNAFENMGSDLSFAAAFLDMNGDGLVISSISSREESRVYAKPVSGRTSGYHLSREEEDAINQAMAKSAKWSKVEQN